MHLQVAFYVGIFAQKGSSCFDCRKRAAALGALLIASTSILGL